MIVDCNFNGKEFSCCENFHMVDSEYGSCFSFNTLQNKYIEDSQVVVNRSTGPGVLTFHILSDAQVTIHSSEELSTNVLDKKFKLDVKTNRENFIDLVFSIIEVDNENVLQYEDIAIRKCRYNYEIPKEALHTYQLYSYGACRLAKSTAKAYEHCGCVHPVRDLTSLKTKLGNEDVADATECLPSCIESELSIIHVSK
nr:uncharacterized protein LOC113392614 [Vanessa tameamea]